MAERLSSYQYTILKSMAPRDGISQGTPLAFDKAVAFNQSMFYSCVRRGFIGFDLKTEAFSLTTEGLGVFNHYTRGSLKDMLVRLNPPARQARVGMKLSGRDQKKLKRAKAAVSKKHASKTNANGATATAVA